MADSRKKNLFDAKQKSILLHNLSKIRGMLLKLSWTGLEDHRIKEITHLSNLTETAEKMIKGEQLTSEEERTLLTIRSNIDVL